MKRPLFRPCAAAAMSSRSQDDIRLPWIIASGRTLIGERSIMQVMLQTNGSQAHEALNEPFVFWRR